MKSYKLILGRMFVCLMVVFLTAAMSGPSVPSCEDACEADFDLNFEKCCDVGDACFFGCSGDNQCKKQCIEQTTACVLGAEAVRDDCIEGC